jgi:hypothetical protein
MPHPADALSIPDWCRLKPAKVRPLTNFGGERKINAPQPFHSDSFVSDLRVA